MDRSSHRNHLIGVDSSLGFLLEVLADRLLDDGQPGRSSDQDDPVEVARDYASTLQRLVTDLEGALDEIHDQRSELALVQGALDRAGFTALTDADLGNVDFHCTPPAYVRSIDSP